ncbi:MAG: Tad domain-containing protein [Cyanobacteria bacterium]|nr:Tad domain-containing protein [Cyanobacteriota bacterium]
MPYQLQVSKVKSPMIGTCYRPSDGNNNAVMILTQRTLRVLLDRRVLHGLGVKRHLGVSKRRSSIGSVLPLFVFLITLMVATLAFAADVTRTIYAGVRLQAAVESAALGALSYATNSDGSYSQSQAEQNITRVLGIAGGEDGHAWNSAPSGPDTSSGISETEVRFNQQDIIFATNPADPQDLLLQLTGRREEQDSIALFFLPAIFASPSSVNRIPDEARRSRLFRVAEVISQPASRIGAGPPRDSAPGTRAAELSGSAVFPLALSNEQFQAAALSTDTPKSLMVEVERDAALLPSGTLLRGAFANVATTNGSNANHGGSNSDHDVSELIGLLRYFGSSQSGSVVAPGVVERGSFLNAFSTRGQNLLSRLSELKECLRAIPLNRVFIFPVVRTDPRETANEVVGFARFRVVRWLDTDGKISIILNGADSVPVRNATHDHGHASFSTSPDHMLPPPVPPFSDRYLLADGQSISARPRAVAMAPSLSPRTLAHIQPPQ